MSLRARDKKLLIHTLERLATYHETSDPHIRHECGSIVRFNMRALAEEAQ